MTAPLAQQTIAVKDPAAVRKRRRRAPAGGAPDDCFSCSKKNIKCDRRRPYCSQCLEVGSECSGYKTQLTWGVGVASRGKLRGLSLPIAKAPPVTREPKKMSGSRSRSSSSVAIPGAENDGAGVMSRRPIDIPIVTQAASAPTTPYPMAGYDYLSMSHPENTPPLPHGSWGSIAYSPILSHSPDTTPKFTRFPLPLVTEDLSSSIDSLHEVDYLSPMSQSFTRDDMPYVHSPTLMYEHYATGNSSPGPQSPPSSLYLDHSRTMAPTSCPSLVHAPSDPGSSMHSHMDFESQLSQKLMHDCDTYSVPEVDAYSTSYNSAPRVWQSPSVQEEDVKSHYSDFAPSHWPTASESHSIHISQDLTSKMPFFIDYYENIMCPSMVFIDGPQNPFREHVLRLAGNSQSLQHAICALASCNLRMKRKLSLGHDTRELSEKLMAEKHKAEAMADAQSHDQSLAEEYQHRNMAVHLLNQQLNDPTKSTHDSVLATILLLCHYRMVESGIAKFHTQFAGVNKILALRSTQYTNSGESAWMEALFTYFDAISASINDREAQFNPSSVGLASDDQPLPIGAENLVGCDRDLFKTIRKLGRLNLLSQNRLAQTMASSPGPSSVPTTSPSPPYISSLGHSYKDNVAMGVMQGQQLNSRCGGVADPRFDGHGFGTSLNENEMLSAGDCSTTNYDNDRSTFWHEWKEARVALQEWRFDAARVADSLPGSPGPSQLRDLHSLSEAFRYAALLYTERLVSPSLPPSHQSIQGLVTQVVYYATSLETGSRAEKFLLWPLFVAGCECVNSLQQDIVRNKCRDIMSRSGYMNNLAALDVLEKLWAGELTSEEARSPGPQIGNRRGPFNWTRCIGGPGVEVEWIMF
ncbi:fungal-specific transcription factor domain-containing protein [Dactylonectria macrodidyma]|uniref:Fungal-specific transcription factor domain-containing protein n=1 Tax=Dactylonectria macrodidyma TaxID=307937 RepID=A0A9P9JG22_9HYPO|nr:fungal-specific transcription factor domain-containing protein [Dactylonectria macrodidyma]